MKNDYQVFGEVTVIFLIHKGETKTTIIPTESFSRVSAINGRWYLMNVGGKMKEKYYVGTTVGGITVYMHSIISMNPPKTVVDHHNHNTLDNRKTNLRIVDHAQNGQNRKGAQENNKSTGIRNVYRRKNGTYSVRLMKEGRRINVGTFPSVEQANQRAIEARKEYYNLVSETV